MPSEWLNNDKSKEHVKQLLTRAGLPLELRVALLCRQFVDAHTPNYPNVEMSTRRFIYQPDDSPDILREVDQCIIFKREVQITDFCSIQVIMYVPIECKHRDHVEIFGIPYQPYNHKSLPFPVMSLLTGARSVNAIGDTVPEMLCNDTVAEICFLEIEKGATPKRLFEENLIYKAGMALYDFIKDKKEGVTGLFREHLVLQTDFMKRLNMLTPSALRERNLVSDIASGWRIEDFKLFNEMFSKSSSGYRIHSGLPALIYFPIVCMDSPLYMVDVNNDGDIVGFQPREKLLSSLRLTWSQDHRHHLIINSNESLITVTNNQNLPMILRNLLQWFNHICEDIENDRHGEKERVLLEACIFQHILNQSSPD